MSTTLEPVKLPGDWYREMAAIYRDIAQSCVGDYPVVVLRRTMNFAEAAKYENIAARLDRTA